MAARAVLGGVGHRRSANWSGLLGRALIAAAMGSCAPPPPAFAVADRGADRIFVLDADLRILGSSPVVAPVGLIAVRDAAGDLVLSASSARERRPDGPHDLVGFRVGRLGALVPMRLPDAERGLDGTVRLFADASGWGVVGSDGAAERIGRGELIVGCAAAPGEPAGEWSLEPDSGWLRAPSGSVRRLPGFEGEGQLLAGPAGALLVAPGHLVRCRPDGRPARAQGGFVDLVDAVVLRVE